MIFPRDGERPCNAVVIVAQRLQSGTGGGERDRHHTHDPKTKS